MLEDKSEEPTILRKEPSHQQAYLTIGLTLLSVFQHGKT